MATGTQADADAPRFGRPAYEAIAAHAATDSGPGSEYPAWKNLEPWQHERFNAGADAAIFAALPRYLCLAQAVRQLCLDTDGEWLAPGQRIPVGKLQAALAVLGGCTAPEDVPGARR